MKSNLYNGMGKIKLSCYMLLWVSCISNRQAYIMFVLLYVSDWITDETNSE